METQSIISKNERAEKLVGKRPTNVVPFDFPCELGYRCPKCKVDWDETLQWSEYNLFIWCEKCNFDYPSVLCVNIDKEHDSTTEYMYFGREDATKVFLNSIESLIKK
jgi:hypothetical protein